MTIPSRAVEFYIKFHPSDTKCASSYKYYIQLYDIVCFIILYIIFASGAVVIWRTFIHFPYNIRGKRKISSTEGNTNLKEYRKYILIENRYRKKGKG